MLASGALGYGGSVAVQNAGIMRTSVSQAALLIAVTPVLVAIIAACWQHSVARPVAWLACPVRRWPALAWSLAAAEAAPQSAAMA